jgi:hypothetical protein
MTPRPLVPALAGIAAALIAAAPATAAAPGIDVPRLLAARTAAVNAAGGVPVLLPDRLAFPPRGMRGQGGPTPSGYSMTIGAAGCGGANACTVARFDADTSVAPQGRRRVRLARGRVGRFTPLSCGASCAPARIEWRQAGTTYLIAAKVGGPRTERIFLVRMANQAILAGPR